MRVLKKLILLVAFPLLTHVQAAPSRSTQKSLLDSEPNVVYLNRYLKKTVELTVVNEAAVFSDPYAKHRLGTLKANQNVKLEAITDKAYRVRGQGKVDGIAGWVSPSAFTTSDPNFVSTLKAFYHRQMQVEQFIKNKSVCTGMTEEEVTLALGQPTKTSTRNTDKGMTAVWEYVEYKEVSHYITRTDPYTGQVYRQFSHTTREETKRTNVEFENHAVTATETSVNNAPNRNPSIIPGPVFLSW